MLPVRTASWSSVAAVLLAGAVLGWAAPALAQSPDAYFEFLMARRYESEGNNQGALAALERAAAADPASAEIRAEIASFHLRRNQRAEAEKAARAAIALNDKNVEANRTLGLVLAAVAESSNERSPSPQAVAALKEAITHLERAVAGAVAPDVAMQFTLGRLYIRNGEPAKAIQSLSRVLSQNPGSVQGRLSLAQAYAASKDLSSAIGVLEEIVEDEPRVASALAQYQEQAGRLTDAAQTYTVALAVQPTNRELKLRRIGVLYQAKEYARAAAFAADARKQHPEDTRFARLQARAQFDAGDRSGAITTLEGLLKSAPADTQTQFALVDVYNDAGRVADAERLLRQIVAAEPANANALNYLGYLLANRGDQLDEAIRLVRRALDTDPNNGAYLDSLGWAHYRRGDLNEAEKYLTAAAERLPANSEVLDHLGDLHARRGRLQEAIDAWTRALGGDGEDVDRTAVERKISEARAKLRR
jgi:tetratricopeptide (TPR) repeat protein